MKCAAAQSTRPDITALDEVVDQLGQTFHNAQPADLAVAFASSHHTPHLADLASRLQQRGLSKHLLGCTGESIVTPEHEVEEGPALALWAIQMPAGTRLRCVSLDGPVNPDQVEALSSSLIGPATLLLLGDPFSFDTAGWLKALHQSAPQLRVIGGMASGGQRPGANLLLLDDATTHDGAAALLIEGPVQIDSIVSQGCRPIGEPMVITSAGGNLIKQLGSRPAVERFKELFAALPPDDQALVRKGLHVGRVINEYQESFGRGDFLVRNVVGADESGALAITDIVRVGQTIQFHVRDAVSADDDLKTLLQTVAKQPGAPAGALLFTCNGRGSRLFPSPDHDLATLQQTVGPIPVAGFFAMGELGPIGGQNFIHGFTASIALFRAPG